MQKIWIILIFIFVSACSPVSVAPTLSPSQTATGAMLPSPTATETLPPTSSPTPTPKAIRLPKIASLGSKDLIYHVTWAPNRQTYTMVGRLGVDIVNIQSKEEIRLIPDSRGDVQYSANSQLISVTDYGRAALIRVRDGEILAEFKSKDTIQTALSPNSKRFAYLTGCSGNIGPNCQESIHIWDIVSNREMREIKVAAPVQDFTSLQILFDPTSTLILSGNTEHTIRVWDVASGQLKFEMKSPIYEVDDGIIFSHNGKMLASYENSEQSFQIVLWDWETKEPKQTIRKKWSNTIRDIQNLTFSNDDRLLNMVFNNGIMSTATYNLATREFTPGKPFVSQEEAFLKQMRSRGDYISYVEGMAFSPNGKTLAVINLDAPITLWDISAQKVRATLEDKDAKSIQYNHAGNRLIVLKQAARNPNEDAVISIWDMDRNIKLREFKIADALAFDISPDDSILAVNTSNAIQVWDMEKGILLQNLPTPKQWPRFLSYSADGKSLSAVIATTLSNYESELSVQSWDTVTGKQLPETLPHIPFNFNNRDQILGLNQGILAVFQSGYSSVVFWDVKSGEKLQTIEQPSNYSPDLLFTPNHQMVVLRQESRCRFFDIRTGKDNVYYFGDTFIPEAFSADGKRFATFSDDGTISVWDSSPVVQGVP